MIHDGMRMFFQIKRLGVLHSGFENMPRPEINKEANRKQPESIQTDRNGTNPNQTNPTQTNQNKTKTNKTRTNLP